MLVAVAVGVRGWGTIAVREARSSDAPGVGVACGSRETTNPGVGARGRVRTGGDAATGGERVGEDRGWLIGMYREAFASFAGFAGPGGARVEGGENSRSAEGSVWGLGDKAHGRSIGR